MSCFSCGCSLEKEAFETGCTCLAKNTECDDACLCSEEGGCLNRSIMQHKALKPGKDVLEVNTWGFDCFTYSNIQKGMLGAKIYLCQSSLFRALQPCFLDCVCAVLLEKQIFGVCSGPKGPHLGSRTVAVAAAGPGEALQPCDAGPTLPLGASMAAAVEDSAAAIANSSEEPSGQVISCIH